MQQWDEIFAHLHRRFQQEILGCIRCKKVVVEADEKILADQKCTMVQSDKGTKFLNSTFQSMLKRHGIKFYTSEKAFVVERYNRTLKD